MHESHRMPTAKDIMTRSVITFLPDASIFEAIRVLLSRRISGAPVVDEDGFVVGMLSELDCLRVLSSDEFYAGHQEMEGQVRDFMTPAGQTIKPDMDVYGIAHYFLTRPVRRLPVVDRGRLVGQVSRRDVLLVIESQAKRRAIQKHYPDYREPSLR
jgi:CBS domain-containing protein